MRGLVQGRPGRPLGASRRAGAGGRRAGQKGAAGRRGCADGCGRGRKREPARATGGKSGGWTFKAGRQARDRSDARFSAVLLFTSRHVAGGDARRVGGTDACVCVCACVCVHSGGRLAARCRLPRAGGQERAGQRFLSVLFWAMKQRDGSAEGGKGDRGGRAPVRRARAGTVAGGARGPGDTGKGDTGCKRRLGAARAPAGRTARRVPGWRSRKGGAKWAAGQLAMLAQPGRLPQGQGGGATPATPAATDGSAAGVAPRRGAALAPSSRSRAQATLTRGCLAAGPLWCFSASAPQCACAAAAAAAWRLRCAEGTAGPSWLVRLRGGGWADGGLQCAAAAEWRMALAPALSLASGACRRGRGWWKATQSQSTPAGGMPAGRLTGSACRRRCRGWPCGAGRGATAGSPCRPALDDGGGRAGGCRRRVHANVVLHRASTEGAMEATFSERHGRVGAPGGW